ncbi:MAG TPA: peptidase S8, partial [Thermoanaerobaculia bacterium]|nr:peptidase S8 [Thermoanaerobaculia bacterium]
MLKLWRVFVPVLLLFFPLVCLAAPPLQPRIPTDRFARPSLPPDTPVESIIIKFHEGTNVRLRGRALTSLPRNERQEKRMKELHLTGDRIQTDLHLVQALLASSREVRGLRRLFTTDEQANAERRARGEARSGRELADLDLYFLVEVEPGLEQGDVESLVAALNAFDSVEIATVETPAVPAGDISPVTPSFEAEQGYLDSAALGGIDARYSWTIPGGKGAGAKMIDVEVGWRPTHEDFPVLFHQGGAPYTGMQSLEHGTAALSEVVALANGYGVTGIAHQAQAGTQRVSSIQLYPSS